MNSTGERTRRLRTRSWLWLVCTLCALLLVASNAHAARPPQEFFDAAKSGDVAAVKKYLAKKKKPKFYLEGRDNRAETALHIAARAGKVEVVRALLDAGATADIFGYKGTGTPLLEAALTGQNAVIELLIERGAEVNASTSSQGTALQRAAYGGHFETFQLLLAKGAKIKALDRYGTTMLHAAAAGGNHKLVDWLLEKKLWPVDALNGRQQTPLYLAARAGHTDLLKRLVGRGAKVNIVAWMGYMPLHAAAESGHTATIEALVRFGAKRDAEADWGWTALHMAVYNKRVEAAKTLIALRADPSIAVNKGMDYKDWAPLHQAFWHKLHDVAKLLILAGADPNAPIGPKGAIAGWRPLHFAASSGETMLVNLLISMGADVNGQAADGSTPLDHAWEKAKGALKAAGAKPGKKTK